MPVKFLRTQLESERDLRLLQVASARYHFDFDAETDYQAIESNPVAAIENVAAGPSTQGQIKRLNKEKPQNKKKIKILSNEVLVPAQDTSTPKEGEEEQKDVFAVTTSDEEDFRFDSQAF